MAKTWTLAEIRTKYRALIGRPNTSQLSNDDADDNLNDYYQNQFPFDVNAHFFRAWLTQALSATDNGIYDLDASVLTVQEPVKVNGDEQIFTMDDTKFFEEFPGNFTGAFVINDAGVGLAIGTSSTSAVKNGNAFSYNIGGDAYPEAVDTETELSGDTIPQNKYGAWRLEIDVDGTVSIQEAADNASGYATVGLAVQGLPAESSTKAAMGYVTALNTASGGFVPGTTSLGAGTVTATFTDGWNSKRGRPSWVLFFDRQLYVEKKSDDVRELKAPYLRKPSELTDDDSTPEDVTWGEVIAYGSAMSFLIADQDTDGASEILPKFTDLINKINAKFYRQEQVTRVPQASF
ncbi:MAG TPA: hypothetical protein ENI05_01470 [Porticoccus sp.]|nr:hypothetical protein [Porticoccus sp.]